MNKKLKIAFVGSALVVTTVLFSQSSKAQTASAPADVVTAVANTTATIAALEPISIAAISAALVPFGSAMALSFVRKVMSKA